ncbi:MAG: glycosyltransferase, partial [Nitrospira sp.]|nr:glycosyltransferase [Nitrospira sp.]
MKIAINLLSSRGGSGLSLNKYFLPALAAHDDSNEYSVILGEEQNELSALIPQRFEKRIVRGLRRSSAARVVWEQLALPYHLHKWRIDVLYTLGNTTSLLATCKTVVVVTNATPFSLLRFDWKLSDRARRCFLRRLSVLSARKSTKLVFISENSRDLICRRLLLPLAKTEIIHYGWTPFEAHPDGHVPDPPVYVLTVAVLWPYKNIERLMKAFDLLVQRHGFSGFLVVAGPVGSKRYHERLLGLRDSLSHGNRVVFTGALPGGEIASLYRHARLFVLPSIEETLGLPLQEAMGCGIP